MANEGEVRLEAKPINFEEMVRRLGAVEQGLRAIQSQARAVDVDIDTAGLERAETAIREAKEELGGLGDEAQDAGGDLDKFESEAEGAGEGTKKLKIALGIAAAAVAAFVAALAAKGIAALVRFGGEVFEVARGLAQLEARLSAAGIGGEKLEQLSDRANQLGLNFERLQDNFGQFLAAWVRAGGDLDEGQAIFDSWTVALSGAGASAEEVDRIIRQLTQGVNRGKFEQEDWNSVAESGIGVQSLLKKAYGENTEALAQLKARGLVPARLELLALAPELVNTFGPQAQQNAEGLLGTISRYENALFDIRRELAEKLTPEFAAWLDLVTTGLTGGSSAADAFGDALAAGLKKGRDAAIGTIATIQAVGQAFRDMFKPRAEVPGFFERIEGNIAQMLQRIRAKEEQARQERAAGDQEAATKADELRRKSGALQEELLKKGTAVTQQEAQKQQEIWANLGASLGGGAAAGGISVPVEIDTGPAQTSLAELQAAVAAAESALSEARFGTATNEQLSELQANLQTAKTDLLGYTGEVVASGQASSTAAQQGREQTAVLDAIRAAVASLGPAFEGATRQQVAAARLQIASLSRLAEQGGVTEARLRAFVQEMSKIFPELAETLASSLGVGTTAAGELTAQIDALEASTKQSEESAATAGEGYIKFGDQIIEVGEKTKEPQEDLISLAGKTIEVGAAGEKAGTGVIKFGDQIITIGEETEKAAEGAGKVAAEVPKVAEVADKAATPVEELGEAATTAGEGLQGAASGASAFTAEGDSAAAAAERLAGGVGDSAGSVDQLAEAVSGSASDREELRKNLEDLAAFAERLQAALTAINESRALLDLAVDARVAAEELDKAASAANRLRENAASVALA